MGRGQRRLAFSIAIVAGAALALGGWLGRDRASTEVRSPVVTASGPSTTPDPPPAASVTPPALSASSPPVVPIDEEARTLPEQRAALYRSMAAELDITAEQLAAVQAIIDASPYLGQGNPALSRHPMTRAECRKIRAEAGLRDGETTSPCARRNMAPLYDPGAGETAESARVCVDRFEFPDIACAYPVVYVSAREAALLCAAVGKRICDAHEWEGACAGALHAPEVEYAFGKPRPYATWLHNKAREVRWAHGPKKDNDRCATTAQKSLTCPGGGYSQCGTNTFPAGAFPACGSPFGVYDQHGNAAEHMNLPLSPEEMASRGGAGQTEMKGSWFAFKAVLDPHEDDCRWRAKDWHPSKLMDVESHWNDHLGFRCCASVP